MINNNLMGLKSYLAKRKARAKEKAAFRKIVEKRTAQIRRQAYEKEALRKAKEEGKVAAREGGGFWRGTKFIARKVIKKVTQPPRKIASRRRVIRRTTVRKRLTPRKRFVKKKIVKRVKKINQQPKLNGNAFMQFGDLYN